LRNAKNWLDTLVKNNTDSKNDAKIKAQEEDIEKLKEEQSALMEEVNKRIKDCYDLIPKDLYDNYTSGNYAEGVKAFFGSHNISATDSLVKFMVKTVGLRCSSAKVMFKSGTTLDFQTKTTFNKLFMSTLAQLMLDKNALKLDMYKWGYEEPKKEEKKSETKVA
jgi:hypothetical protein